MVRETLEISRRDSGDRLDGEKVMVKAPKKNALRVVLLIFTRNTLFERSPRFLVLWLRQF